MVAGRLVDWAMCVSSDFFALDGSASLPLRERSPELNSQQSALRLLDVGRTLGCHWEPLAAEVSDSHTADRDAGPRQRMQEEGGSKTCRDSPGEGAASEILICIFSFF